MAENNTNKTIKIRIENPALGVPITFLDKYNPEQFEILNANDCRKSDSVPVKSHGLIKDKEGKITLDSANVSEQTATNKQTNKQTNNYSLCKNCHQEVITTWLQDRKLTASRSIEESSSEEKRKIKIKILNPLLGVPITFLDKHNPEQFEIIGISVADSPLMTKHYADYIGYRQDGTKTGRTGSTFGCCPVVQKNDGRTVYYKNIEGIEVQATYQRIFIRQHMQ